jgi:hypothetical protein
MSSSSSNRVVRPEFASEFAPGLYYGAWGWGGRMQDERVHAELIRSMHGRALCALQ